MTLLEETVPLEGKQNRRLVRQVEALLLLLRQEPVLDMDVGLVESRLGNHLPGAIHTSVSPSGSLKHIFSGISSRD